MQRTTTYAPAHCFSNYFTIIAVSIQWLITFTTRDKKQIRKLTKSLDGGLAPNTLLIQGRNWTIMARVENNEKNSAECRPSQTKTTSSHSFSIQDILGLDKTREKPDLYSSENSYFSSSTDTVIKIEPGSPTTTHLGILYYFISSISH
jgi:hypothetical protein